MAQLLAGAAAAVTQIGATGSETQVGNTATFQAANATVPFVVDVNGYFQ